MAANLRAIHDLDPAIELAGLDINPEAIRRAQDNVPGKLVAGSIYNAADYFDKTYDVVFTCAVLTHIPPENIKRALEQVQRLGRTFVLFEDNRPHGPRKTTPDGTPMSWYYEYETMLPNAKVLRPAERSSDGCAHLIVQSTPDLWLFYGYPYLNGVVNKAERGLKRLSYAAF
jgi:hypothetical protein